MQGWSSLPKGAKFYIAGIIVAATPLFVIALQESITRDPGYEWLLLTLVALVTVPIFVYLPSGKSLVTMGDAIIISICMTYGTSEAVLANTLYIALTTLLMRRKLKTPAYRINFNLAIAVLNAQIYGLTYYALNPEGLYSLDAILLPTFGVAISFFLSNSFLVAGAISLCSRTNLFEVWSKNYIQLWLGFFVASCSGAFILLFSDYHALAPLLIAPFVAAVWGINTISQAKAVEAQKHLKEQEELYLRTVESLALAVDAKDQTTYGHIRRVKAYAMGLAKLCGITDPNQMMAIETGSLLHDIGKLAIDDYILNKPGRLSKQEFEKMKMHAAAGDEILQQIRFPFPVADYVRCHHERWDGTGYPSGLKGEDIPLGARILTIADAFDAIRSSRPYKLSFGIQDSIELLRAQSGIVYDPKLLQLFISHIEELEASAQEAAGNVPMLSFRKYFEKVDLALSISDTSLAGSGQTLNATVELVQLAEFCDSVGKHLGLPEILSVLAIKLKQMLPFSTCAFFLLDGEDHLAAAYVSGKFAETLQNARIGLGKGISGWTAAYKRPMINTSPALEFQELSGDFSSFTDALVVPMLSGEECIGTISLYAEHPVRYTADHLTVLQTAARLSAPMIMEVRNKPASPEDSLVDPTTETYRVTYLSMVGAELLSYAADNHAPLSLLTLSIENLSQILSLYGVGVGNSTLRGVAGILKAELRETDVLVRYGHSGFVALLPGVRGEQALRCAQRLQSQIRATNIGHAKTHKTQIDCQTAVASYPADGSTIFALLESAQQLLETRRNSANKEAEFPERNILDFQPRIML